MDFEEGQDGADCQHEDYVQFVFWEQEKMADAFNEQHDHYEEEIYVKQGERRTDFRVDFVEIVVDYLAADRPVVVAPIYLACRDRIDFSQAWVEFERFIDDHLDLVIVSDGCLVRSGVEKFAWLKLTLQKLLIGFGFEVRFVHLRKRSNYS